jgi:hypothetical protein
MIQRIQSIWLLLASICTFAGLKISFYTGNMAASEGAIPPAAKEFFELNGMYNLLTNTLTICVAVICLITIFLYNNRKLQIKMSLVGLLLQICTLVQYWFAIQKYSEGAFSLGALLPALTILFVFLAIMGIRRDSNIVKESNRLR